MSTTDPSRQDTEMLGRRFVEALHALESAGDYALDEMVALFAPDATLSNAALRRAGAERTGADGVREFWSEYVRSFKGARTEFRAITCSEHEVGLFWTTHATDPDGGERSYDGASLVAYDGQGRVVLFSGYYDPADLQLAPHPAQTPIRGQDVRGMGNPLSS